MKIFKLSFIFFYLIRKCFNYIVYPLKIYNELDTIENFLLFNSTYTTLEMGTPPQKVDFYFSLNHSKIFITDVGCRDTNLFDIDETSSFFTFGEMTDEEDDEDGAYSSRIGVLETFYYYDNINLTEIIENKEVPIYFSVDLRHEESYFCGNIGLSIMQYESFDNKYDELDYFLKFNQNQNNYFSFFNYNGKDFIINDIFLHQEFKDMFQDVQNITWINPLLRENSLHWEISMKEIYYNNKHFKDKITFELNPLFELIIGNYDYKNNIQKDFFDFYIGKKICIIKEIKDYQIFECDANKFAIKDIKKFPTLYMYNIDINHVFEMNGEDLFIELNKKIYFKIIFSFENLDNLDNRWILGKIFLRKYPVIFSQPNRLIGFYVNPNGDKIEGNFEEKEDNKIENKKEIKNERKNNSKNISLYITIIIIALIFTCFGLFIGRKIFFIRKKKINELIDNYYHYDSETKKENPNKKENKIEKSFAQIEMNSNLQNKE